MKKILSFLVLSFVAVFAFGADTETVIFDGSQLTSSYSTEELEYVYGDFTLVMSKGAKAQSSSGDNKFTDSAILIGKLGSYIYNKTAFPGKIVKFELYANKGASAKVTVGVNFSNEPIAAYNESSANTFASKLETDKVYDLTDKLASDTRYFWYQVTNANNSQVEFRITYELPAGTVKAPEFSILGGDYYEAQNVELTAGEGNDIYYSFDGETYSKYENAISITEDATLYAYAQSGDTKSKEVSATYQIAKVYASLVDLCQVEPAGQPVVVTLKKEAIVEKYKTSGIYLMAGDRKMEIYCYDAPEAWQVGGTLSGTLKGLWKNYNGTWEVCPSSWDGLTYFEYPNSLQNGQFDAADAVNTGICTYDYDMTKNNTTYSQQIAVTSWEIPANGNARAGGVFQYGSGAWLGGTAYTCPATDKNGNADGACLGLVAVWTGTVQYTQDIKLPAGSYSFAFDVLNTTGASPFAKSLFYVKRTNGNVEESIEDSHVTFPAGEWTKVNIPFVVEDGDIVTVSLGYQAGNYGSGAAQHLFVDNVEITEGISKDVLTEAIKFAKAVVDAKENVGSALFQITEEAYDKYVDAVAKAQAVVDDEAATSADIEAAVEALALASDEYAASVNAPDPAKNYTMKLEGTDGYLGFVDGGIKVVADGLVKFQACEDGDFYITSTDGSQYVGYLGTNAWSMTAAEGSKSAFAFALVDGKYTVEGANGLLGTNSAETAVGSTFYGDKKVENGNVYYTIAEEVTELPVAPVTVTSKLGASYEGLDAAVPDADAAAIVKFLGITSVDDVEIYAIMPDGSRDASVDGKGATDGWRNAEGNWCQWGTDGYTFYSQPYFDLEDGVYYIGASMGSAPNAITEATAFTTQFVFANKNNGKEVTIEFTLVYPEKEPTPIYPIVEGAIQTVEVERAAGLGYTATKATYNAARVCKVLGISDITEAAVYGIDASVAFSFKNVQWLENAMENYDGWRDANGDFCTWGENAAVCVKIEKTTADNITICTYPTQEPAVSAPKYNAYWILAANEKAVLIDVQISFVDADGENATAISAVESNDMKAVQIYDLNGRQVKNITRGQVYIINGKKMILK